MGSGRQTMRMAGDDYDTSGMGQDRRFHAARGRRFVLARFDDERGAARRVSASNHAGTRICGERGGRDDRGGSHVRFDETRATQNGAQTASRLGRDLDPLAQRRTRPTVPGREGANSAPRRGKGVGRIGSPFAGRRCWLARSSSPRPTAAACFEFAEVLEIVETTGALFGRAQPRAVVDHGHG